ncbi:4-diphosphocytidyl-2C-methyl-D-erythritol kinase [Marinomonas sp. MED121]|uniref:4-(cytidine 5'-diphospho)-2-C-methyl-D-erythritol kinase n=1 Tax=Marinomonas sp. MED121 TaxID=314277 RepID=UPI0000690264|nr:4-(cytidine 5'-diphospho)-2-C-methyl-D-erythritol kinase [Marinomonas sp. MED121]EAQ63035.1 4-diphosphocytidyl-2C-methyl-D-erythritol kinase [Marinomonas sp. MED121]
MIKTKTHITLPSPAKLNLFLHITGRRENGYHELETLFQFIDVCDTLSFTLSKKDEICLLDEIEGVKQEDNLIYKAAKILLPYRSDKVTQGIEISIQKQLPMGGGIGGGSSNAATTLLALNQLWQCHLDLETLAQLGLELGADVPIFVFGKSAFAQGIGEELTQVEPSTPYYLLLKPDCEVKTVQIFTDKNLTRDTPPIKIPHALKLGGHNDCLEVVRKHNPEVNEAYLWLKNQGDAKLTGTGSCLFAAFDSRDDVLSVLAQVPDKWLAWQCQGCNISPTHQVLDQWIEHNWGIAKR